MTPCVSVTRRDRETMLALVHKVRVLSVRQIAGHWWNGEIANARRRLRVLFAAGLFDRVTVLARPLPPLRTPVLAWEPCQPIPDFGHVAYQLKSRWRCRPARQVSAVVATPRAAQLLGGKARGGLKCGSQATHDLGVAAVWLHFNAQNPAWAAAWRSEDLMAHTRRGQKLPDAFLVDDVGRTFRVVEFGGAYDAERVRAFHEDCARRGLPYEIW